MSVWLGYAWIGFEVWMVSCGLVALIWVVVKWGESTDDLAADGRFVPSRDDEVARRRRALALAATSPDLSRSRGRLPR